MYQHQARELIGFVLGGKQVMESLLRAGASSSLASGSSRPLAQFLNQFPNRLQDEIFSGRLKLALAAVLLRLLESGDEKRLINLCQILLLHVGARDVGSFVFVHG